MRHVLFALTLCAASATAREIPAITAGTDGNPLLITIANGSAASTLRNVTVSAARLPAGVRLTPALVTIESLEPGGEHEAAFVLEAGNTVRLDAPDTLLLHIRSAATGLSTRAIVLRFVPPAEYSLAEVFPNPFNPSAQCEMRIAKWGMVRVALFDLLGREVAVLKEGVLEPGVHTVEVDGRTLASGVYFLRMTATPGDGTPGFVGFRKVMLLR